VVAPCTMTAATPLRVLLLDTETNGLPKNRYAPASQWDMWPAILQISWAIYRVEGRTMMPESKRDIGVALHPSIAWDVGAAAIHEISEAEARRGTPAAVALGELAAALRTVDIVVAHNLSFDKPVIRAAAYAEADRDKLGVLGYAELRAIWPASIGEFCTMQSLRDVVRIPSPSPEARNPYKVPRLGELYEWLYGHVYDISGGIMHTARSDTHCLAHCLMMLLRRGLVCVEGRRFIAVKNA
jgi:DNA polymerase III epsilon subunit-like protein